MVGRMVGRMIGRMVGKMVDKMVGRSVGRACHGLRGSGLARLRARRHMTQIFRFRLVLLGTPPPSSDP